MSKGWRIFPTHGIKIGIKTFIQIVALAATIVLAYGAADANALSPNHITGTVTTPAGAGASDVTVFATDSGTSSVVSGPVTTGSDGTYTLDVSPGTYDIHFEPASVSGLNPVVQNGVVVLFDQVVNVQLTPIYHSLSGTLSDGDGLPIQQITIELRDGTGQRVGYDTTDISGHFMISAPATTYSYMTIVGGPSTHNGQDLAFLYLGAPNDVNIDLTNGDVSQNFSLNLAQLTVIAKSSGVPVAGASVTFHTNLGSATVTSNGDSYAFPVTNNGSIGAGGSTGANGAYSVLIPQGLSYTAGVNTSDERLCVFYVDGSNACHDAAFTASDDVTVEINQVTHNFSGTLTDNNGLPIQNVSIGLKDGSGQEATHGVTDASGHFSMAAPAATYSYMTISGGSGTHNGQDLAFLYLGAPNDVSIDLRDSDVAQNFSLNLVRLTAVAKKAGNPVAGASISFHTNLGAATVTSNGADYSFPVTNNGSIGAGGSTGADGSYSVLIPQGLSYTPGVNSSDERLCAFYSDGSSACYDAAFTASSDLTVEISEVTHNLSGTLSDNNGSPLQNITIGLNDAAGQRVGFGTTDAAGHFVVTAPAATYTYLTIIGGPSTHDGQDLAFLYLGAPNDANIDLTDSDVAKDFTLNLVKLTVFAKSGTSPIVGASVSFHTNLGAATVTSNGTTYSFPVISNGSIGAGGSTGADGSYSVLIPQGLSYTPGINTSDERLCVFYVDGTNTCHNAAFTASGNVTIVIQKPVTTPSAPTNISASSPARQASLTWSPVNGATSYNVYRDNSKIGSSSSNNYVDNSASSGTHAYSVTTVNSYGESNPSNTVSVVIDTTPPTVTAPTWSSNPLLQGQNTTLSVSAQDGLSGVDRVEYTVEGGSPQQMTLNTSTNTWEATFGAQLPASTYAIAVTAYDKAGNVSAVQNDVLAVYTTTNGYVTGHTKSLPTILDVLPISRDTSNNPTKLITGFTNVTAPTSGSFDVSYTIKNNQDAFSISSTSINWVVVQDSTHASILGHGDLTTYVNGAKTVTQNVGVRFDIALGTNGAQSQIGIKIFNPGLNPNTDAPTYTINDQVITNGSNLMIHP